MLASLIIQNLAAASYKKTKNKYLARESVGHRFFTHWLRVRHALVARFCQLFVRVKILQPTKKNAISNMRCFLSIKLDKLIKRFECTDN